MADRLDEIEHRLSRADADTVRPGPDSVASEALQKLPKRWGPAGVIAVFVAAGTFVTVSAAAIKPLVEAWSKPDLSGYVTRQQHQRDLDDRDDEITRIRRTAGVAARDCADLKSQFSGLDERQESLEKKRRR